MSSHDDNTNRINNEIAKSKNSPENIDILSNGLSTSMKEHLNKNAEDFLR